MSGIWMVAPRASRLWHVLTAALVVCCGGRAELLGSDGNPGSSGAERDDSTDRPPVELVEQAYLSMQEAIGADGFGSSIALDGDTLAVGAYGEGTEAGSDPASQPGAVHIFVRSNGTWSQQTVLSAPNAGWGDHFGFSVALEGNTLAVGAPGESSATLADPNDDSAPQAGAVYVFQRAGVQWEPTAYLKAPYPGFMDRFGWTVAVTGNTLAVHATEEGGPFGTNPGNAPNYHSGAVHVFVLKDQVWSFQATLKPQLVQAGQRFGVSLALFGDLLAVGAPGTGQTELSSGESVDDGLPEDMGAAFVFAQRAGVWSEQAHFEAPRVHTHQYFGSSVALEGKTLVVGASGDCAGSLSGEGYPETPTGAAYVFNAVNDQHDDGTVLRASDAAHSDNFGAHLALEGDTLFVSAPSKSGNPPNSDSGAVYAFRRVGDTWTERASLRGPGVHDEFGQGLALDNGTLAVGSHYAGDGFAVGSLDASLTQPGAVFIFTGF